MNILMAIVGYIMIGLFVLKVKEGRITKDTRDMLKQVDPDDEASIEHIRQSEAFFRTVIVILWPFFGLFY